MTEETKESYYGAYQLFYNGKDTGMHFTVFFRDDTTEESLEEIKDAMEELRLSGSLVYISEYEYLSGPNGEPNAVWTCLLKFSESHEDRTEGLRRFSDRFSFRKNLEQQYSYTMHTSVGNSDSKGGIKYREFIENKLIVEGMGGINSEFTVGEGYIKNLRSKEIACWFQ